MSDTIWVMEKKHKSEREWTICFGPWLGGDDKKGMQEQAKRFTEDSVGWKFRAVPYDRRAK